MSKAPVEKVPQEGADMETEVNTATTAAKEKPKCQACCACPETKRVRDECIMERGEENCAEFIEAHKQCMRVAGFNV